MRVIKQVSIPNQIQSKSDNGTIFIVQNKINRIFLLGSNRLFSLHFPFKLRYENNMYYVRTKSGREIDNKTSSDILSLIYQDNNCINIENICQKLLQKFFEIDTDSNIINIFCELMLAECGYIRFDKDRDNENGNIHPLYHFDICYSDDATYKLGIDDQVNLNEFIDILNVRSNCYFLIKK